MKKHAWAFLGVVAALCATSLATAATECGELVMPMRALHADIRSNVPLTPEQDALWRLWNQHCTMPMWQAELVREGAPVQSVKATPAPRTWRNDVADVLQGAADYMDRTTTTYCQTQRLGRGAKTKIVTSCY